MLIAKEKEPGLFEKKTQEAAGHNSEPPKQTYYCGSGLLMNYPLEKLFGRCFFYLGFNKASYILGNSAFLRILSERSSESN